MIDQENLNLEYWWEIYVKKALARSKSIPEAANMLGVSEKTIKRRIEQYGLNWKQIKADNYGKRFQRRTTTGIPTTESARASV